MKSKVIVYLIYVVFILLGCSKETSKEGSVILVDESKKQETALLSDIAENIEVISLETPKNILFGEIGHIKTTDNYIGLFDEEQTKSVTLFNHKGKFINQLRKVGQGPGEYTNITDFTFNTKDNIIFTYDRDSKSIFMYSLPDLDYLKKIRTRMYLMVLNSLEDSLLVVSDEDLTETTAYGVGYATIDTLKESFDFKPIDTFPNVISIVDGVYPNAFSRNEKGMLYVMNSQYPVIYQLSNKEITPIATIDFGANKIPDEYWEKTDMFEFNLAFETPPLKSALAQNVIVTDKNISFYYMFGTFFNRQVVVYNRETQKTTVVGKVLLEKDGGALPYALGVYNDSFLTLLFPEDLDELFPNGLQDDAPKWLKDIEKSLKENRIVCLKYKMK